MGQLGEYAEVKVEGADRLIAIPISWEKPEIPASVQERWQTIADLVAEILCVPTGLITRLTKENLEIFVASATEGNPYKRDDYDRLGIGMFCESVAGRNERMLVANTDQSDFWRDNPHAKLGMRSYLGVPIHWEDGELFGTFCMLDSKANPYSPTFVKLLEKFKDLIEADLRNILLQEELEERLSASEMRLREMHHRVKNQFNILTSYISMQSHGISSSKFQDTLKEIQHRVTALSLVHENLYKAESAAVPELGAYLPRLCSYILDDFVQDDVVVEYDIDTIVPSIDAEISIGLMVSELITNSLKYAFSEKTDKVIKLSVKKLDDNMVFIEYRDNGQGLPPDFDPDKADSLGMKILCALTSQLRGSMEMATDRGAVFSFKLRLN